MGPALSASIAESPEPEPTTSQRLSRSSPAARASAMPSASAAAFTAARVLLISLTIEPWPCGPTCRTSSPIASNSGRARSKAASAPPAMIVSVPSSALGASR